MPSSLSPYIVVSALALSAIGFYLLKKKHKNFIKVGRISKLYFYPVKSLSGFEVTNGKCTKFGFEVNGMLDRSFMLVNDEGVLISQRQAPSLALLKTEIRDNNLIINGPKTKPLTVEIKQSPSENDKIIKCKVHTDLVDGVDCGDEAAAWFNSFLDRKDVRFVQFFSSITLRKYTRKDAFFSKLKKDHPVGFQDLAALHMISEPSIDDLNSRLGEKKVSALNFRPNILVDDCNLYAEDSWKYIKFQSETELLNLALVTRCLLTTNDPETGILSQKEPLVTLRKYRIPSDPEVIKVLGALPCLGVACAVTIPGEITVGDDIFAVVEKQPKMQDKSKYI